MGHLQCSRSSPSGKNNQFGLDFKAAGFQWTKELCIKDSDGDGLTNGEELGDPCCTWDSSKGTESLRSTNLSHPGDVFRTNTAEKCAADQTGEPEPTTSPSNPTATSSGDADGDDSVCFPGSATVTLIDGSVTTMAHLNIGQMIQVSLNPVKFSRVLGFSHRTNNVRYGDFVSITADDGSKLTLTKGHYMYLKDALIQAQHVNVGDVLLGGHLVSIVERGVDGQGLFNPHTEEGTIVIDGLLSSCYTTAVDMPSAHALLAPIRALSKVMYPMEVFDMKDGNRFGLRSLWNAVAKY